jgi:ribose transport system permease protein
MSVNEHSTQPMSDEGATMTAQTPPTETHVTVPATAASDGAARASAAQATPAAPATSRHSRWAVLSPRNVGAFYVLALIIIVFSFWVPDTFPTTDTIKQVLDSNAITAMAALALIVPLSARTFDLSFAYTMSLSGVTTAHLIVQDHFNVWLAASFGILVALLIGVINGIVVVVMKIDSFIGTLATGSLVQAFITYFTSDVTINDPKLVGTFSKIGQNDFNGITYPVVYALVLAVLLWLFMEYSATGRRVYVTGFKPDAARLASIRVDRLRFCSLLVSAGISGFAGVCLASSLSAGSPSAGTPYLLPAFAAVFVGATQLKNGRFNSWGTIVAVLMLGTGTIGLGLATAPPWAADMFTGVVLLAALGATGLQRRTLRAGRTRSVLSVLRRKEATA